MTLSRLTACAALLGGLLLGSWGLGLLTAGQPNFDHLLPEDRKVFAARFEKEVWPLLTKDGKNGCVGCHSGKIVSALKLTGKLEKDFPMLLKDGFFLLDDEGSLLARVTDKDKERRMPKGKTPWTEQDVQVLRAFTVDVHKKQRK
jgi:hypothetical protein